MDRWSRNSLCVSVALTVSVAGSTPSNAQCAVRVWTTGPLQSLKASERAPAVGRRLGMRI